MSSNFYWIFFVLLSYKFRVNKVNNETPIDINLPIKEVDITSKVFKGLSLNKLAKK